MKTVELVSRLARNGAVFMLFTAGLIGMEALFRFPSPVRIGLATVWMVSSAVFIIHSIAVPLYGLLFRKHIPADDVLAQLASVS